MRKILPVFAVAIALALGCNNAAHAFAQKDEKKKSEKSEKTEKSSKSDKSKKEEKSEDSEKSEKSEEKSAKKKDSKKKSLYSRLGGKKAIRAVVDEFVTNVANDTRINKFFADAAKDPKRLEQLKNNLVNQICEATGGSCKYKGKDMVTAHKGMGITDADFTALVEDLVAALKKLNVPQAEQDELLAALASMKGQIVGQ